MDRDYFEPTDKLERRVTVSWVLMVLTGAVFAFQLVWQFLIFRTNESMGGAIGRMFALHPLDIVHHFRFWQLVTYSLLHEEPLSLFFNLMTLYFFGNMVEELIGTRRMALLWFGGVLATAATFFVVSYLWLPDGKMFGPDGAILALIVAAALQWPDQTVIFFFFPMRLKYVAMIMVAVSLSNGIRTLGPAHLSVLAGAAWGFGYWKLRGRIEEALERWDQAAEEKSRRGASDAREAEEAEVDRILAKIRTDGIASLAASERRVLDRASRKKRGS